MRRFRHVLAISAALCLPSSWAAAAALQPPVSCDRACLYRVLDDYLLALKSHDPQRVRWAAEVHNSENNVLLRPGDGLWGTITALDRYEMRLADPVEGQVAVFGVLEESTTRSPYVLRLKVVHGAVSEVETIVARPQDAGVPFVTADIQPLPVWDETVPPGRRGSRAALVAAADGYFDSLQLNDGTLHVGFTDDCNRRENGMQTTNNPRPDLDSIARFGCAAQFRLGQYRYDDRLRERRYLLVDEERGIVLAAAFIDHEGRLGDFMLTDGTRKTSMFRRPHSFAMLEAFKVQDDRIRQVEAVFVTVPYNMPSPWTTARVR